jgi:hypothetical protein
LCIAVDHLAVQIDDQNAVLRRLERRFEEGNRVRRRETTFRHGVSAQYAIAFNKPLHAD